MPSYAVNIEGVAKDTLSFFGYEFIEESEEFLVFRDKYREDHIVQKTNPMLYVEDRNDAMFIKASRVIDLSDLDS